MTAKLDRLKKTEEEGIKRLQAVRAQQAERKKREDEADNTWELPFFEGEQPKGAVLYSSRQIAGDFAIVKVLLLQPHFILYIHHQHHHQNRTIDPPSSILLENL